ncbi:hypothetical protein EJ08DRAFT_662069 [Tothia fuscella]|uniref:Uncharacterized protein n=1 Tax=Tothia fuscella TaxID=1048955 RepID=A0A9P4NNJ0_9PEZI|nr:hypothetical protein EJ08DRAFT_662069 [Tothia fuscella]
MATSAVTLPSSLWFLNAVQAPIVLMSAFSAGATFVATPLTMPMVSSNTVPAKYQAHQWELYLHGAEHMLPPLNSVQTLANVVLSILVYRAPGNNSVADAKLPKLVLAALFNIATTAFSLGFMVPLNSKMRACGKELNLEEKGSVGAEDS